MVMHIYCIVRCRGGVIYASAHECKDKNVNLIGVGGIPVFGKWTCVSMEGFMS